MGSTLLDKSCLLLFLGGGGGGGLEGMGRREVLPFMISRCLLCKISTLLLILFIIIFCEKQTELNKYAEFTWQCNFTGLSYHHNEPHRLLVD